MIGLILLKNKKMIVFPILFFSLVIIVEIYAFYAFKTAFNNSTYNYIYVAINILIIIYVVYNFSKFDKGTGQNANTLFVIGLLLITFIPKMVLSSFLFIEDILRIIRGTVNLFTKEVPSFLPERREFISKVALFTATIPFFSILYGVTKGKYNFKVLKQKIAFKNLPSAFDGFTITHISDIHSGSLDNAEKVTQAIEKINDLNSDILLFTGDIVNSYAREFDPWYEIFNKIKDPKYGKFL